MSKSSRDQGSRGPRREGSDQPNSGPERRGMRPEDEELISKPVSRQDEMMRVAIAGFLGLFVVSMALAQSRMTPEPIPEPPFTPMAPALPTPPPVIAELLPPPPVAPLRASGDNRLYGRVVTSDGQEYEGYLRWDRNEGSWTDLLDAKKRIRSQDVARNVRDDERLSRDEERRIRDEERWVRDEERRFRNEERHMRDEGRDDRDGVRRVHIERDRGDRHIEVRGVRVSWRDNEFSSSVSSGIRFGHIRRIESLNSRSALVSLRSGEEVYFDGNATDLGSGLRRLVVADPSYGNVELRWSDIDVVEFMDSPSGDLEQAREESLYGTMTTRSGMEFTGYVAWDVDEIFHSDILDGEEAGVDREIRFGNVAKIARNSSGSARVTLQDGTEMVLRGTNDVDSSNNGISISDPALGQVKVDWSEFEEIRFHEPENHTGWGAFDGGHLLYGTVTTLDGTELTGQVKWDNDEAYSWEMLNGESEDVEFHVEFGQVESVKHRSHRGASVTLLDGRVLQLSDSNDVSDGNRGIVITAEDGDATLVSWEDFEQVRFHTP